jgi:prephenate dehydrogenase
MALNITIVGLDTLGRSLGLALGTLEPEKLPEGRPVITGWDQDKRTLNDARGNLMIDRAASDIADAVRDADVVFVSTPLSELEASLTAIASHLKHSAVVSDLLSAKSEAVTIAQRTLPTTVDFIGGHPILAQAGRTQTEPSIDLFRDAMYCLVTTPQTRSTAINLMEALVTAMGAKPYYIDAHEHDIYIAGVEHLPVLVSVALMEALSRSGGWREMQPITGGAFRSATALSGRTPAQSRDMCLANQAALHRWLNDMIRVLVDMRDNLHNGEQLEALFHHAQQAHTQWLAARPNLRPGEDDLDIPNEPSSLGLRALLFGRRGSRDDKKGR